MSNFDFKIITQLVSCMSVGNYYFILFFLVICTTVKLNFEKEKKIHLVIYWINSRYLQQINNLYFITKPFFYVTWSGAWKPYNIVSTKIKIYSQNIPEMRGAWTIVGNVISTPKYCNSSPKMLFVLLYACYSYCIKFFFSKLIVPLTPAEISTDFCL